MSWRDRDYNRGGEAMTEFFGNPAMILGFSIPFGSNWFGSRVRLHFWLLLSFLFVFVMAIRTDAYANAGIYCGLLLFSLLAHEFGHRIAAELTGGRHDEFLLWPCGGLVPAQAVPQPLPFFLANAGGIFAGLFLCAIAGAIVILHSHDPRLLLLNPFLALAYLGGGPSVATSAILPFWHYAFWVFGINEGLILVNLLPYFWFDGGFIWQAILWPWTGLYQAINVTCIAGMVIAVPMFAFALYGINLLAMIFWALLFASNFMKRQTLKASGPEELQEAISYSASLRDMPARRRRKISRRWFKWERRRASREQRDQAQIDVILAKVHDHGLHSLTWREKRTLKQATARQRERDRDVAGRR